MARETSHSTARAVNSAIYLLVLLWIIFVFFSTVNFFIYRNYEVTEAVATQICDRLSTYC